MDSGRRASLDIRLGDEFDELAAYPLGPDSTVVIIGGYKGETARAISLLHGAPRIVAFEPQTWATDHFMERCDGLPNIELYPYGLGERDDPQVIMGEAGTDACSFLPLAGQRLHAPGAMREITGALAEVGVTTIDLLHMNCEGYEWVILPLLIESGRIAAIPYLMIQFHYDYVPADVALAVEDALAATHRVRWHGALASYERKAAA